MTERLLPLHPEPHRLGMPLTRRQQEALRLYAELGQREAVAQRMGLSLCTVMDHLHGAYVRLGVTDCIAAFRALGWLRPLGP